MQSLKDLLTKYRKRLLIPTSIMLGIIVLLEFFFVFEITPQPNDECLWKYSKVSADSAIIYFDEVKFEGVTWNAGIRDGDYLIAINGKRITSFSIASNELNTVSSGDSALYLINRDGQTFEANVEVKKLINFSGLSFALLGALWLIVGILVVSAKPDGEVQVIFLRIGATLVLYSSFNVLITTNIINPIFDYPVLFGFIDLCWTFGGAFLPILIIHFFLIFPKPFKVTEKKWALRALYLSGLAILLVALILRLIFFYPSSEFLPRITYLQNQIYAILLYSASIIGLISLFINYLRLETKHERNSIFFILVSYAIGVGIGIYQTILYRTGTPEMMFNSPEYFMPIILISIVPMAFGFSIFKYSLMDVTDVIKTTLLYGVATVALAALYFFTIYVVGQSISSAIGTEYQVIITGVIFIFFALVFQSTKDRFQELLTRNFYPEQFAYQQIVLKFTNDVNTIVGLENILSSTCNTFVESLKLDKFGIALRDKENPSKFKLAEGIGFSNPYFEVDADIVNLANFILSKRDANLAVAIEEYSFNEIFPDDESILNEEGIYTVIPLLINSRIIGFTLYGLKFSGSKFAGNDLALLVAATNQLTVAIENARLYGAEKEKLIMDRDLENAKIIQESLLPNCYPEISGLDVCGTMIPAMYIGGDYYDLLKVSDSKMFVIVGDVSGKGLSASLYMSKLQTMMQLYCTENRSPKEVLTEVNKRIFSAIGKNWFITVSVALFDTSKNSVAFCRAGHTPLLVANNGAITTYRPEGIGVGLEKGDVFDSIIEQIEIPIQNDDLFAFFSDGVNESMNEKEEQYGFERLNEILKNNGQSDADSILNGIVNSLTEFRSTAEQHDDITLVLIKASVG